MAIFCSVLGSFYVINPDWLANLCGVVAVPSLQPYSSLRIRLVYMPTVLLYS
jgi:hypothetical protein